MANSIDADPHRNVCTPSMRSGALPCCSASSCMRRCHSSRHQPGSGSSRTTIPASRLAVLFFAIHVFRMTTFFLIAGFFAHLELPSPRHLGLHQGSVAAHCAAAGGRLADPVRGDGCGHLLGRQLSQWRPAARPARWPPVLPRFPLTHLWFLYVLLEFYVALLVLRAGVVWLDPNGRFRARLDRLVGLVMRSRFAPALLAVPIGIALCLDPTWIGWLGVRTPDSSLVTNLQAWIGFGTAFGFGWLLHRQIDLLRILERRWLLNLGAGDRPDRGELLPRLVQARCDPCRSIMRPSSSPARSATRLRSGPRPLPRSVLRCDSFPASVPHAAIWPTRPTGSISFICRS